jgi:C1A family cysteine protease
MVLLPKLVTNKDRPKFEYDIINPCGLFKFEVTHAVLLVGYNKNNNTFIARNSWGKYWGDRGYFYMPFQVIQNTSMSSDFWVIKSISNT